MEVMGDIYFTIIAETEMILTLLQRNITKYFYCLRILFPAFLLYFGSVIISILSNKCFQSLLLFFQTNVMWEENDMFQIYRRNSLVLDTLVRLETFIKIFQFSFDKVLIVATEVVGVRSRVAILVRTRLLDITTYTALQTNEFHFRAVLFLIQLWNLKELRKLRLKSFFYSLNGSL